MSYPQTKRVGIVGGGVSGIAAAKAFRAQGHDVVVFERLPSIGGVWHPGRSYPGVQTQSPKELYRFTDLAYPEECPEWPSGEDVRAYLQRYVAMHDLARLFRFNSAVTSMEEVPGGRGWVLHIQDTSVAAREYQMRFYFVVVCTGTFTDKRTVDWPGQDDFLGAGGIIVHSSEYKDLREEDLDEKHVVIIGGSKSATDIAVHAAKHRNAKKVTLVMRRNVWRVPRFILGVVNFKHLLYMKAQEVQFPGWNVPGFSILAKLVWLMVAPLIWLNFRMLEILLICQLRLRKFGMVPDKKIEDCVSCSIPIVPVGFFDMMAEGRIASIIGSVHRYEANVEKQLVLGNGEGVKADVVIQATGWTMDLSFLPEGVKNKLIDGEDGLFRLHRFAVNPSVPNIGFVGLNSSFCSVLSSEMIANWLVRFVDGQLANPKSPEEMEVDMERILKWKREVFPAAQVYNGNCIAPFHHLHFVEILEDIGATVKYSAMFTYPRADRYGECLRSAPSYAVKQGFKWNRRESTATEATHCESFSEDEQPRLVSSTFST
ncbi:hypothetical protein ACHAXT_012628 [Thalassiosira profunda]